MSTDDAGSVMPEKPADPSNFKMTWSDTYTPLHPRLNKIHAYFWYGVGMIAALCVGAGLIGLLFRIISWQLGFEDD